MPRVEGRAILAHRSIVVGAVNTDVEVTSVWRAVPRLRDHALGTYQDLGVRTFLHRLIEQPPLDRVRDEDVLHVGCRLAEQ